MKRLTFFIIYLNLFWVAFAQVSNSQDLSIDLKTSQLNSVSSISGSYCTNSLNGGNFDIAAVSINGTTLNNTSSRPGITTYDGSLYTFFTPSGSNTCTLNPGGTYTLNVLDYNNDIISVWIDYNQNGIFEETEWTQVTLNSNSGIASSVLVNIPMSALSGQTGLRIRSRSSGSSNGASDACSSFGSGCTEDYTITISSPTPSKPVADFNVSSAITTIGSSVQLNDLSTGVPTSWKWTLTGGTPATSISQQPIVSYSANGSYAVKLVVSNQLGKDSITKSGFITVAGTINMPVTGSSSVTTCGMTVYDNGGKATYSNSSNGVLTINPGTQGNAVKLQFSEFNVESYSDALYVYNGTSTSAPQIGTYYGNTIPAAITATNSSGALTLRFTSDGSSVYSGFVAQSSCVPLILQNVYSVSWTSGADNNLNTYSQSKTLNFTVKNDDVSSATIYAKIYRKSSSENSYTLLTTSSLIVNALSVSANQLYMASGFSSQDIYDFKIELYNSSNRLLNTYDLNNNSILGGQRFESAAEDILPAYCINGLMGGSFDISAVSINGTTLNNSAVRTAIKAFDGSYYTLFAPAASNTCTLTSGSRYILNVTNKNQDNISVWIDYNQDLTFQSSEWVQVAATTNPNNPSSVSILIPNTALNGPTRMRIRSNYAWYSNGATDACSYFNSGCTEEYTVTIAAPVLAKPVVDFDATATNVSIGSTIQFNDFTTGAPATWKWTFHGGTPATSISQYPSVLYSIPGTYAVKLVAGNSMGSDSITKSGYITVINSVNMPASGSNTITACGVTIYDNGGTSNYANSLNGVLTINPVTPGSAVRLQFSEFNTESCCDALSIYNGTSTSAAFIGQYGGSAIPPAIIATNATGALTLRFSSDGSSTGTGFVAQASCVPLTSQYVSTASWSNSIDNNYNGYPKSASLSFTVKNDDTNPATLYAKIYSKLSPAGNDSLLIVTSGFVVNGSSLSASQAYVLSGFSRQGAYDVKIEIYNSANTLLNTYDLTSNAALGSVKFESVAEDGLPIYCVNNLGGGSFDISSVSINGTLLNNSSVRAAVRTIDGSYYTEFPLSGSNTCTLFSGFTYMLNIATKNNDIVSVWIDYNHDSVFQSNEWVQVTTSSIVNSPSSVSILIPGTALIGETKMRIRSSYTGNTNGASDACTFLNYGCTEDYTITIATPVPAKPGVNFTSSITSTSMGSTILYNDVTSGVPTSWKWTFQGGIPATSTSKNPSVLYNTPGTYDVKLVARNTFGADSLTKSGYITVVNSINVPASGSNSITGCGITIYDNGGTSNYANSTNGTLTINPDITGNAVRLQFSEFNLESCCDYLSVYNGTSTSAALIGSYGGSVIPATIRATNSTGALTLRFSSDGSSVYSGFVAQSTCVPLALHNVTAASWTNNIDNNYNGYCQSRTLNITTTNNSPVSSVIYAKIYSKLSSTSTYDLLTQTANFVVGSNSISETILYNVFNVAIKGYYDFKIELYNASGTLISSYDLNDNSLLKNQGLEPASADGLGNYCTSGIGGSSFDITGFSITGTTLNNNLVRPSTGSYSSYTAYGNYTGTLTWGASSTLNVTTTNNDIVSVWIDFDHSGTLDPSEWTQITPASNSNLASASVYVPTNALTGPTRLRVRTRSSGTSNYSTDACTSFSSGCTEDYVVTIQKSTPTENIENSMSELKLYPNPATDVLNISVPGFTSGTLCITDMLGRRVSLKSIAGDFVTEDVSGLNKGMYIVTVTLANGTSIRKQILIQK